MSRASASLGRRVIGWWGEEGVRAFEGEGDEVPGTLGHGWSLGGGYVAEGGHGARVRLGVCGRFV